MRRRATGARVGLLVVALVCLAWSDAAAGLLLARRGQARARVVLADGATAAEATAASELASYLGRVSGATFEVVGESSAGATQGRSLWVGPTAAAAAAGIDAAGLGEEEWRIRPWSGGLLLVGGRPRGTLYAVFHFLEDRVGVRWWTPWEESVPSRRRLVVPSRAERGEPAFGYRDVHGIEGPRAFMARSRDNGQFAKLSEAWGGVVGYGPPYHVHTFFDYVPPDRWFDEHPEWFSKFAGVRVPDGQLCMTSPGLRRFVLAELRRNIDRAWSEADAEGRARPMLFDVSQNDWGRPCECDACSRLTAREGSPSGPLLQFVNALADGIAESHPGAMIDTLAYHWGMRPPRTLRARDNVVVRFSGLQYRDFLRPLTDPSNSEVLEALRGWRRAVTHLRIWDYSSVFGLDGELPLPNETVMAEDLRLYLDMGIEGVFVQHPFPIAGDFGDMKLWMLTRLLEDPRRDARRLEVEFTDGYYGRAGRELRCYRRMLSRAAGSEAGRLRYRAASADFGYLDARFLRRAQRRFDRAERVVASEPRLVSRVRHARLTLDRATLTRWRLIADGGGRVAGLELDDVVRRYRSTWAEQIDRRLGADWAPWALEEVEREIAWWTREASTDDAPRFDKP